MIQKSEDGYELANPGTVRISISDAVEVGISDPRNAIMLKIFSLIEFGERDGSGLSGICKRWEKVYHTPVTIEETHKDGVPRTVLTLFTGGHEQDVQAMIELYSDLIDSSEPRIDTCTTQTHPKSDWESTQKAGGEPQNDQKTAREVGDEPQNEKNEPQNGFQKLLEAVRMNPKITKAGLSELLGVSISTLKRWLKANDIVWVGHSKNGHWEIVGININKLPKTISHQ